MIRLVLCGTLSNGHAIVLLGTMAQEQALNEWSVLVKNKHVNTLYMGRISRHREERRRSKKVLDLQKS